MAEIASSRRRGGGGRGVRARAWPLHAPSAFSAAVRALKIVLRHPRPRADREPARRPALFRKIGTRCGIFVQLGFDVGQAVVEPRQLVGALAFGFLDQGRDIGEGPRGARSTRPAWFERRPSPVRAAPRVLGRQAVRVDAALALTAGPRGGGGYVARALRSNPHPSWLAVRAAPNSWRNP